MKIEVNLKVADIVIKMQSDFALEQFTEEEKRLQVAGRFKNFFYEAKVRPDIVIKVNVVDKLPKIKEAENIFITTQPDGGGENWRLIRKRDSYVYKSPLENKTQVMLINATFDRAVAYLLPKKDKGWVWNITDIIYDFLQVLLINYLALKKKGVITHSVGVKDLDGRGLLFNGKSKAGKSTAARLWHRYSKGMVLNDDRIIVRKLNGKFFIYGSPWHGDFSDYLASRIESAPLEKLFFIHHSPKNTVNRTSQKQAFNLLYPAIFPPFWDKQGLENTISFCQELLSSVPCYHLGFVNDKRMIGFVRNI
jgi:hypothetical protein